MLVCVTLAIYSLPVQLRRSRPPASSVHFRPARPTRDGRGGGGGRPEAGGWFGGCQTPSFWLRVLGMGVFTPPLQRVIVPLP